ncbi:hypothetical protein IT072_20755 (plasmid) [Leifsonia sp. ZF2019]|uniref:hypothetical protein n=1 Tax=Leifsonia sp. ZF2019 TaxID=2781978 RepID=UPI001CBFDCC9|nr:hypothetical protein [Leifsonia sp. ZF2019]UAJ81777.1 hypothetical protein IT072_20755 [Leifsonia sp. ZF2019]
MHLQDLGFKDDSATAAESEMRNPVERELMRELVRKGTMPASFLVGTSRTALATAAHENDARRPGAAIAAQSRVPCTPSSVERRVMRQLVRKATLPASLLALTPRDELVGAMRHAPLYAVSVRESLREALALLDEVAAQAGLDDLVVPGSGVGGV